MHRTFKYLLALSLILAYSHLFANFPGFPELPHGNELLHSAPDHLSYVKNKGQWEPEVKYRVSLVNGEGFLLENRMVFCFRSSADMHKMGELFHNPDPKIQELGNTLPIRQHAYSVEFVGGNMSGFKEETRESTYQNYYLGQDRSKWATNVPLFESIRYQNLFRNIDLRAYSKGNNFKYDFILAPGADPRQILLRYQDLEGLKLQKGNLILTTSVNELIEQKPFAYQEIDEKKVEVKCRFVLDGNDVSFRFPKGYDSRFPLIIDPVLIASTNSGSTATIYGHTATYDQQGNIFVGGGGFSPGGLPLTAGAFQTTYGGSRDYCINKFNPDGSGLIFSTYIGGSGTDLPHSMVTNQMGDLYVLGSTRSINYPIASTAYQSFSGGSTDIGLTKLNSTGTTLLGSTYIGGTDVDGINSVNFNYGDSFRGEVVVDALDNVYLATMTQSSNFPTTSGAWQSANGGGQDGALVKLNSNLSAIQYSTYIGGLGNDVAYGVIPDNQGGAFVCGTIASAVFGNISGAAFPAYRGGNFDGFVAHFNNTGGSLLAASYFGTALTDQAFFVEEDRDGDIYIYGETDSAMQSTTGRYSGPGTGGYITKFTRDLTSRIFTTAFGEMAPTAFLVDNCGYIYAAGHGLSSTYDISPSPLNSSSSSGFYLMVLEPNATALNYGTYYGGGGSHVDGGTSRFDKRGFVYEATCTGGTFPTTPNAYSTNNNNGSWDMTVFKIDFQVNSIIAQAMASPRATGCAPLTVNFVNTSLGQSFQWDFRDGSAIDTSFQPSHTFNAPGIYQVRLIAYDSTACVPYDTDVPIQVLPPSISASFTDSVDCPNSTVYVNNTGTPGVAYEWDMGDGSTYTNLASLAHTYANSGTYTIQFIANDTICNSSDTAYSTITISNSVAAAGSANPNSGCAPLTVNFTNTSTGNSWIWDFGDGSPTTTTFQPSHTYATSGNYTATVWAIDSSTCNVVDSTTITITVTPSPVATISPDTVVCNGAGVQLLAGGGTTYFWQGPGTIQPSFFIPNPTVTPSGVSVYTVIVGNGSGCFDTTSVTVTPVTVSVDAGSNLLACSAGGGVDLSIASLSGGSMPFSYLWSCNNPPCNIDSLNDDDPHADPASDTRYYVTVTDSAGCTATDSVDVTFTSTPAYTGYSNDTTLCAGQTLLLDATSPPPITYRWQDNSTGPTFQVTGPGTYWVEMYNICDTIADTIVVNYDPYPTVSLPADTTLCPGEDLLLNPVVVGANRLRWRDGSTANSFLANSTGRIWVTAISDHCGIASDSIYVRYDIEPNVNLGPDKTICPGEYVALRAGNWPNAVYQWSTGESTPVITVEATGQYWASATLPCGTDVDTFNLVVQPAPEPILPADANICPGDTMFLSPGEFTSYTWQDGTEGPVYTAILNGVYSVLVTDSVGCEGFTEIEIGPCDANLYVPNAFTPNGDPLNDRWFPVENGVEVTEILIFNRWGETIFVGSAAQPGWDGFYKGKPAQEGVYTYLIRFELPGGKMEERAGTITLLR